MSPREDRERLNRKIARENKAELDSGRHGGHVLPQELDGNEELLFQNMKIQWEVYTQSCSC